MSRYHSYLNSAVTILKTYKGTEPFAHFLKIYFAQYKKFGSKDRKQISHLCYCYFRLGKAFMELPVAERILTGLFLSSSESNEVLQELDPDRNEQITSGLGAKAALVGLNADDIFPWQHKLSDGIDKYSFAFSHLQQPDLFLRIRPGKEKAVQEKLAAAGIQYESKGENSIALRNASKIDSVLEIDKEVVIQDLSSQRTGELLVFVRPGRSDKFKVWDCCAASGGKSIMAMDILGNIDLTVSDIRQSILTNLDKRFAEAGIKKYHSLLLNLAEQGSTALMNEKFSLAIADVPCSGSGTWGRTPEQLCYFDPKEINEYAKLQKKILANTVPAIAPGGYMLYITCSVFKKENEEAITYLKEKFHLQLVKMELIKGYDQKADTMFTALLKRSL